VSGRNPAAWTDQWIRELPGRHLKAMRQCFDAEETGIARSRQRRLEAEWERRKREGGGGWCATLEREQISKQQACKEKQ
jgi:hypothetical protein